VQTIDKQGRMFGAIDVSSVFEDIISKLAHGIESANGGFRTKPAVGGLALPIGE
jgi:hypothetical protein